MFQKSKRTGFTLIEVLIVVVIMAVLAATIIPQFASSTQDAKASALKFDLHTLRSQIEMYKLQHNGTVPTAANFPAAMTQYSDATGNTQLTSDATHPFGPYVQGGNLPVNPYDQTSPAPVIQTTGPFTSATAASGAGGWLYDQATGNIAPNTTGQTGD